MIADWVHHNDTNDGGDEWIYETEIIAAGRQLNFIYER